MFEDAPEERLHALVFDANVPVLLEIGATWCGPCKQLQPVLEQAAIRSGGALRLVTLDGDKRRQLVGALKVKGYPTVFAVRDGRLVDRFVGVPATEDLQAFVTRALVGTPRPPPPEDDGFDGGRTTSRRSRCARRGRRATTSSRR